MEITEVRIKLMGDPSDRLSAFCSITLDDCFVVRDLKIIQGVKGAFVAMPSRKLSDRCPKCHSKNQIRALFCNQCGVKLHSERALKDDAGRAKLYADIAHPINSVCRDMIQKRVIEVFQEEIVRAKQEGYTCSYDDYEEERFAALSKLEAGQQTPGSESEKTVNHEPVSPVAEPVAKVEEMRKETEAEKTVPAETVMNLETEAGKILRIDTRSEHESHASEKQNQSPKSASIPSESTATDAFGNGII